MLMVLLLLFATEKPYFPVKKQILQDMADNKLLAAGRSATAFLAGLLYFL